MSLFKKDDNEWVTKTALITLHFLLPVNSLDALLPYSLIYTFDYVPIVEIRKCIQKRAITVFLHMKYREKIKVKSIL